MKEKEVLEKDELEEITGKKIAGVVLKNKKEEQKGNRFKLDSVSNLLKKEKFLVMGVLNVTEDSFYDGGRYLSIEKAIEHAFKMKEEGANIIDIGAESTKPFSDGVETEVEKRESLQF